MLNIYTNNINNRSFLDFIFENYDYVTTDKLTKSCNLAFLHDELNGSNIEEFSNLIRICSNYCKIVILFGNEFHGIHLDLLKNIENIENFYYICPAKLYNLTVKNIFHGYWLKNTSKIYKKLSYKLDNLQPYSAKLYYFDALLGSEKQNRQFVYDSILDYDKNKFILSYSNLTNTSQFIKDDDVIIPNSVTHTHSLTPLNYNGVDCLICQIISTNTYKNSAYSIVTETNVSNPYFFPTEKITKPILARRLFIPFTSQYFLKNLQELGFKTFNSVIDESFDDVGDDAKRWTAAFEQVKYLCNQSQEFIFEQIKDICDYNYNHLMTSDWDGDTCNKVRSIIDINI